MPTSSKLDTRVLDAMLKNLDDNMTDVVAKGGLLVEGLAKIKAPVDTGALRASIYTSMARSNEANKAMNAARALRVGVVTVELPKPHDNFTAHVGPSVEYGEEVELGSSRRAGTPYLQPALREAEKTIRDLLSKAVKNGK